MRPGLSPSSASICLWDPSSVQQGLLLVSRFTEQCQGAGWGYVWFSLHRLYAGSLQELTKLLAPYLQTLNGDPSRGHRWRIKGIPGKEVGKAEPGGFSELSPELPQLHRLVSGGCLRILSTPLLLGFWHLPCVPIESGKGLSQP